MMNEKNKKKNKVTIIALVLLLLAVIAGTSYALWQLTFTQTGTNIITTGCLNLILTENTDAINLTEAYPITDEEGKKLAPYTFTIENTCEKDTGYIINLESFAETDYDVKWLPNNVVRVNLVNDSNELFFDTLYDDYLTEEKVIEDVSFAYKIHKGILKGKESKQFSLRVWLEENTPATDEVMNASWQAKITIIAELINNDLPIIKSLEGDSTYSEEFWYYRENISKIIIEDNIHEIDNATEVWNVADDVTDETKRVMAYLVKNQSTTEDLYTLYLQGNGGIKANEDSSVLFGGFTSLETIEGLKYFNTSGVINMRAMFAVCPNLKSLDLSSFDTSKVTDMGLMFNMCSSLTDLNLNGLDMSKVTDMNLMFNDCANLTTTIDITNPNISDYTDMLYSAATEIQSQIIINYTAETSDLVDQIIATKSEDSNVVKGTLIS